MSMAAPHFPFPPDNVLSHSPQQLPCLAGPGITTTTSSAFVWLPARSVSECRDFLNCPHLNQYLLKLQAVRSYIPFQPVMQKVARSSKRTDAEASGHQSMAEDVLQISLYGQTDFQVSQQLQQMNRVLEATNSTLRQQLRQKITQLGQREEDLQGSRTELAQSQERLQVEQKVGQATKEQLQACQSDGEKTKEALRNKEIQRMNLEQRLSSVQDTLKPFFTCLSPGICSGKGEMVGPAMKDGLK